MAQQPRKPLADRLDRIERRLEVLETIIRQQQAASPTPASDTRTAQHPAESFAGTPPAPTIAASARVPRPVEPTPRTEPFDVERVFKWGGVALLILAAAFLTNLAIERGWLTPPVRVAGGLALGAAMYAFGHSARDTRPPFGTALQAGGAVVTYLMVWAGFRAFELYPFLVAGAGMLIVVGVLFLGVFRDDDLALGALATVGGFAVPFLLSSAGADIGDVTSAVLYTGFFICLTWLVHLLVGWHTLHLTATVAAISSAGFIWAGLGAGSRSWLFTALAGLIAIAYWLLPTLLADRPATAREAHPPGSALGDGFEEVLADATPLIGFPVLSFVMVAVSATWSLEEPQAGWLALGLAAVAGLVAWGSRNFDAGIINGLLGSVFVSLALALFLDGSTLAVALTAQAAALLVLHARLDLSIAYRLQAVALASIGLVIINVQLFADHWESGIALPVSAFLVAALLAVGALASARKERVFLAAGAHLTGLLLILHLLGGTEAGQAVVTGVWALIGVGLVLLGRNTESREVEYGGLGTLGLVVIRLLIHLEGLDPLARVFVFLGVGVLLLVGGWYVQKVVRADKSLPPNPGDTQ